MSSRLVNTYNLYDIDGNIVKKDATGEDIENEFGISRKACSRFATSGAIIDKKYRIKVSGSVVKKRDSASNHIKYESEYNIMEEWDRARLAILRACKKRAV